MPLAPAAFGVWQPAQSALAKPAWPDATTTKTSRRVARCANFTASSSPLRRVETAIAIVAALPSTSTAPSRLR